MSRKDSAGIGGYIEMGISYWQLLFRGGARMGIGSRRKKPQGKPLRQRTTQDRHLL